MNVALKYYDQMEIIPIYQSSVILNNVLCGGIIFNEFSRYVYWKVIVLFVGFTICIVGILIIVKKNQLLAAKMHLMDVVE